MCFSPSAFSALLVRFLNAKDAKCARVAKRMIAWFDFFKVISGVQWKNLVDRRAINDIQARRLRNKEAVYSQTTKCLAAFAYIASFASKPKSANAIIDVPLRVLSDLCG